ncbi:MAG: hypothetical protein R6V44_09955 [Paracoccaceae bacterium]
MTSGPRAVLVALHGASAGDAALEAGVEVAAAFRCAVRGLYVEDPALPELLDLPHAFRPAAARGDRTGAARRAMAAALSGEARRAGAALERFAVRAGVGPAGTMTVLREAWAVGLARTAAEGDLVVIAADLSQPRLDLVVAEAARLCATASGVLVVPERGRSGGGRVIAVSADGTDAAPAVAARIAEALGAPAAVLRLGPGAVVDADTIGVEGARLLICSADLLDRLRLEGPESPMRRFRTPLLILGPQRPV